MNFRQRLIQLRDEHKLSQQELADMLDVSRQTVSRWEAGKSVPSANQIANICKAFHLDANEFVGAEVQPAENGGNTEAKDESKVERKKLSVTLLCVIGALIALSVAGFIVTICYAVKDAMYDASATVWIVSIPQNTPMIILSIFLTVFIALLTVLFIYLLRGRRK